MKTSGKLHITTPSDTELAMTRTFDAPRTLVWRALTEPALIRRWLLGPPSWTMTVCDVDLRVGGNYRYEWRKDTGTTMGMGGEYREIKQPDRIVQSEKFDDPWYEGEAVGTALLVEKDGRTTLTTTVRYNSKATRDGVLKSPMEDGVAASYDRMEELLAELA